MPTCQTWPKHYTAWREYSAWLVRSGRPLEDHRDFGGELVSAEGMITLSKGSICDVQTLHPSAIDSSVARGFTFSVDSREEKPWAMVTLAGPCELRGIVVVNRDSDKALREVQFPFEVEVSDDNAQWQKVFDADKLMETYRFEFKSNKRPRARYVRVRRLREMDGKRESEDDFRLSKILVYGKKLY